MIHEASSTGSPRRCVHRLAMTCSLSGGISISNCTPFGGICQRTTGCFTKLHRGCGKSFRHSPIPSPGGRVARRAGRGIRAETYKPEQHHRPPPELPLRQHLVGGLHISEIITLPPAFLISHGTAYGGTMTARNCGVIAPGNHWILDSLRGAPPPGEAFGRCRAGGTAFHSHHCTLVSCD